VLVLLLEYAQAINIECPTHFNIQLLLNFDLLLVGEALCVLVVNYGQGGPILKSKINERLLVCHPIVLCGYQTQLIEFSSNTASLFPQFNDLVWLTIVLIDEVKALLLDRGKLG